MMENIHSEMYANLICTYFPNPEEQKEVSSAIQNIPIIAKMAEFANKWMNSDRKYAERLVAFSAFEGILFSGPFCAIYWMRTKGKLNGLCMSNDFIARDEALHVDFAVAIHDLLLDKCSKETMHEIIDEAVKLECEFITEALPCRLIGMNSGLMKQHIKYVADRLLKQYGCAELYNITEPPFDFIDNIGLLSKKNFFEKNPNEYSRGKKE